MARRFEREELLRLRASPLVAKPANLPPLEEWMGAQPDQNQTPKRVPNRSRPDEASQDGIGMRRPTFESRLSRTNVSEDIVLGPPKTAFASAGARNASKTVDSPNRTNTTSNDEEGAKSERSKWTDTLPNDTRNEKDGDRTRDTRPENLRLRRDDNERWGGAKKPKTPFDDSERSARRNGDREPGRDAIRGGRGFDSFRRNGDRDVNGDDQNSRRNGQGRGRNEPAWYREDDLAEAETLEPIKDTSRRDWRDRDRGGGRGPERDWNKGGRTGREPEWMDEPQAEEKKQAHTQEDFQRWKEKMKAGSAPAQEMPSSPGPKLNHERTLSGKVSSTAKGKAETPLVLDSTFDGFFGMWGDTKKDSNSLGAEEQPKKPTGKPSKFTGFFAPKTEPKIPQEPAPASAPLPDTGGRDSSNEDKEGFQRILKLLDQQQSTSSRNITPFRDQPRSIPQSPPLLPRSPPLQPPPTHSVNPLESIFNAQPQQLSQERPAPQSRESEFLLKLMQQPQPSRPNQPPTEEPSQQSLRGPPPPGLLPFSNLTISPQPGSQQPPSTGPPPGFFNDMPRDDLLPRDKPSQRKTQPPPPGFFDDFSSLHRPPGLDMFPPPPQQPPQQRQPPVQPPPGFPSHMRNPNAFPPGLMPDRGAQFGGRGQGIPPPGFFGMNAPPGFPPMGFGNGGGQENGFGRGPMDFADFGGQAQGQGEYGR